MSYSLILDARVLVVMVKNMRLAVELGVVHTAAVAARSFSKYCRITFSAALKIFIQ